MGLVVHGSDLCSDGGGGGLLAWGHVLDAGSADTTRCGWCPAGACGGPVRRVAARSTRSAGGDADVVDVPGRAAGGVGGAGPGRGPAGRAAAAGAGRRRTATRSAPTPGRPRRRRGWRTRPRPRGRLRSGTCTSRRSSTTGSTPPVPRWPPESIDVEKARVVTAAVDALTDEHDHLPEGTRERAEAHMLDLAKEFDAPSCGSWASGCSRWSAPRLPTRPRAASWRRTRPRRGRWRTSRSATTATAPARARSSCPPCTRTC